MTAPFDYTALHQGAVLGAIAERTPVAVAGPDRAAFLQGLLTNDILALTPGRGCYAAWLTPQGRMLCDLHVFESGDMILLDVPSTDAEQTAARLEQFHFVEDVRIANLAETLRVVWLHGPDAPRTLASLHSVVPIDYAEWVPYQNARAELAGTSVVVARVDQLGVPGYAIYVDAHQEASVTGALASAGALQASSTTLEAARIECGYPVFGVDMTSDTIPLEAGIEDRALSLTKGCYVGQEVIIRVLHRGHGRVARKLVRLRVAGAVPGRGEKIVSGDRDIGFVTSAAESPALGPIALGYVHRDFVEAGSEVEIRAGDLRVHATVAAGAAEA